MNNTTSAIKWKVKLDRHRSTWHYFTENAQGGGFGSNYCGPKYIALNRAIAYIPAGDKYLLTVNGKQTTETKQSKQKEQL